MSTMSTMSTIALSLAVALGSTSIAAALKQVPGTGYQAYGRVSHSRLGLEPTYIYIQDHDYRISNGIRG